MMKLQLYVRISSEPEVFWQCDGNGAFLVPCVNWLNSEFPWRLACGRPRPSSNIEPNAPNLRRHFMTLHRRLIWASGRTFVLGLGRSRRVPPYIRPIDPLYRAETQELRTDYDDMDVSHVGGNIGCLSIDHVAWRTRTTRLRRSEARILLARSLAHKRPPRCSSNTARSFHILIKAAEEDYR